VAGHCSRSTSVLY